MRIDAGGLSGYQPLTKLGLGLLALGLWMSVGGWLRLENSRDLVAKGVRGDAVVKEIRRRGDGSNDRYVVRFEIQNERRSRISREFKSSLHGFSRDETVPIVYLPAYPNTFQFGEIAVVDYSGIAIGGISLFFGILLPFVERWRERRLERAAFDKAMEGEGEFSQTEERNLFGKLDLTDYQRAVEQLKNAGFLPLANVIPINKTAKGGIAKLERWLSDGSSLAVLRVVAPGFVSQLRGAEQRQVFDFVSLLADGTFIVTSNGSGIYQALGSRENVILVDMPESMTELMLKQAHDVRLRENLSQRGNIESVPIKDAREARQVLDGLVGVG